MGWCRCVWLSWEWTRWWWCLWLSQKGSRSDGGVVIGVGRCWCTCSTQAYRGKPGKPGGPKHGSLAFQEATHSRFSILNLLNQTQTWTGMPATSGDPNHGSLAFQEATHTMLRSSESLENNSSTRNMFSCLQSLKYLQAFTWVHSINKLFVHSLSLHMS